MKENWVKIFKICSSPELEKTPRPGKKNMSGGGKYWAELTKYNITFKATIWKYQHHTYLHTNLNKEKKVQWFFNPHRILGYEAWGRARAGQMRCDSVWVRQRAGGTAGRAGQPYALSLWGFWEERDKVTHYTLSSLQEHWSMVNNSEQTQKMHTCAYTHTHAGEVFLTSH